MAAAKDNHPERRPKPPVAQPRNLCTFAPPEQEPQIKFGLPTIIEETRHWIALDKPPGLSVERNPWEPSLEDEVWKHLEARQRKVYLGIVHRLDKVTSGVLLMAKKKSALKKLNEQFRQRRVEKTYLALTDQPPPTDSGRLRHWLKKDSPNKRSLIFSTPQEGAAEVELRFRYLGCPAGYHLLELQPREGKFHQIRAQLAAAGLPIVGDEKYGSFAAYAGAGIALHAWRLRFFDPETGEPVILKTPPPFQVLED